MLTARRTGCSKCARDSPRGARNPPRSAGGRNWHECPGAVTVHEPLFPSESAIAPPRPAAPRTAHGDVDGKTPTIAVRPLRRVMPLIRHAGCASVLVTVCRRPPGARASALRMCRLASRGRLRLRHTHPKRSTKNAPAGRRSNQRHFHCASQCVAVQPCSSRVSPTPFERTRRTLACPPWHAPPYMALGVARMFRKSHQHASGATAVPVSLRQERTHYEAPRRPLIPRHVSCLGNRPAWPPRQIAFLDAFCGESLRGGPGE